MITRIELKNFMSHTHTVIEPAAGLTVLVGPNNVGKSAIVAALQILSHNDRSDYVIRHGEKECSITVQTHDEQSIEWRRKRSPSYVINGQQFDRLGKGGIPDELNPALRLPNLGDSSDADFDIHFGTQKSPIFLLDSSPANAAKFFASSSDAIRLVGMQKRHKEKLSDAKKEKTRLEAESTLLTAELEQLVPVVDIDDRLEQLEAIYEELQQLAVRMQEAAELEQELLAQAGVVNRWSSRTAALKPLVEPPELKPTAELEQLIAAMEQANITQIRAEATAQALSSLQTPPELHDVQSLELVTDKLLTLQAAIRCEGDRCELLQPLAEPPELSDTEMLSKLIGTLEETLLEIELVDGCHGILQKLLSPPQLLADERLPELIRDLARAESEFRHWENTQQKLSKLREPPQAQETAGGEKLLQQMEQATQHVTDCEEKVKRETETLSAVAAELRAQAEGEPCPVCGEPLDPEKLLARAAAGLGGHGHD